MISVKNLIFLCPFTPQTVIQEQMNYFTTKKEGNQIGKLAEKKESPPAVSFQQKNSVIY